MSLDPAIEKVCTRIYKSDQRRYRRLILWVRTQQKKKYTDPMIADALRMFEAYKDTIDDGWWGYLTKLIAKVYAEEKQGESKGHKTISKGELDRVGNVLLGIIENARGSNVNTKTKS